ncbi:MAG: cache domain-containing protein [Negativicutes bacterium]
MLKIVYKRVFVISLAALMTLAFLGSYVRSNPKECSNGREYDRIVKLQVETVVSLIQEIYNQQQKGLMSETEAKRRAAGLVRSLRYDNGNYFWIDTTDGVNVVLLGRDQEGKSRIDARDKKGNLFIREMIKTGSREGGGFIDYWFAKPNQTNELPKRGYTLLFKPYKWIVGTGYWIGDAEKGMNKN